VTVTAITNQTLANADVSTLRNLTQVIPGFVGGRNVGGFQPVIRGVGSSGIGLGDESNVATYVDGVYQAESVGNWLDLVEVERVEVLRGPQGTVFGRNATGGLVNIITPDPSFETRGKIALRYGRMRNSAEDVDARVYASGPINDTLAADFSGLYRQNDGYIKDLVRGGGLGYMRVVDVRSKLLWKPADTSQIIFTAQYMNYESTVNAPQPEYNPVTGYNTRGRNYPGVIIAAEPWEAAVEDKPRLDMDRLSLSLRTRFEFDAFNLETTTGYQRLDWWQATDQDMTNIFLGQLPAHFISNTFSQEVRLLSTGTGRLKWLVGAYFYDLDGLARFNVTTATPGGPVNDLAFKSDVTTKSYAGFAEATYELVDTLFLTGGVRYTKEDRTFRQNLNGAYLFDTQSKTFNKWTYRGALRWQFNDKANIYVSYGTGFKSGVFNMLTTSPVPVRPETIKAWEGGIKADPLPWLRTNLSAFHYDYTDLQVQAKAPDSPASIVQNAATAKLYGGEFELTASPLADLTLTGNVAYNHARYDHFPLAQAFVRRPDGGNTPVIIDASGKQMLRAPDWTFSVGFDWGHSFSAGRLGISGNVYHSSRVYYDFGNVFSQKPYEMVNGQIAWTTPDEAWKFTLWTTNLFNAKVYQQMRPSALATDTLYEQPRRVGIGAEMHF
jgi:iron complex outermembrane receptor protein